MEEGSSKDRPGEKERWLPQQLEVMQMCGAGSLKRGETEHNSSLTARRSRAVGMSMFKSRQCSSGASMCSGWANLLAANCRSVNAPSE
jgi:hypothetical protein